MSTNRLERFTRPEPRGELRGEMTLADLDDMVRWFERLAEARGYDSGARTGFWFGTLFGGYVMAVAWAASWCLG